MKIPPKARDKLAELIDKKVSNSGLSFSEIGKLADVDAAQTSRICRGQFKTLSANVRQICITLDINPEKAIGESGTIDAQKRRLMRGVMAIWDKTPEDADRIVKLLKEIENLRDTAKAKS